MVNMGPYHEFLEHVHLEAVYLLHNIQCHTNMTNKQKTCKFSQILWEMESDTPVFSDLRSSNLSKLAAALL